MKKKIFALLAVFAMCLTGAIAYSQEADAIEIYVSENGNDQSAGTLEAPLKTVPAAVSMASKYRAENLPVRIIFRGGTYRFSKSVVLPVSVSGTKEESTTFESYEGEKAMFKGSVTLDVSKAKPVTDPEILDRLYENVRDKVVVIDPAAQGISQSDILNPAEVNGNYALSGWEAVWAENNAIYIDGVEQQLSRWPNNRDYATWKNGNGSTFAYSDATPSRWAVAKDFWISSFAEFDYIASRMAVKSIDTQNKKITVIDNVLNGEGLVNPGYLDLGEYFTKDNWAGALKVTSDSIIMAPEVKMDGFGGTTNFEAMTGSVVFCFDAEFKNAGAGSYITFGLSNKNDVHQYKATSPGYYIVVKDNLVELQKCGSSGGKIYGTKEFALSDGNRHQMRMGRIKLATGNLFFVDVDGENLFTMYDIDGTEVTASAQIAMATYQAGERIALYPYSGELPSDEAFNEMKKAALYASVKPIYDLYSEDLTGYGIISLDHAKVINADGLYNVSNKPVLKGIDDVYVTADAFEKLANCKVSVAGSVATVSSNGATVEIPTVEEKGVAMIPVKELCSKLNKTYTFDGQNRTVAVADSGTFVVMNTLTRTKKASDMFAVMAEEDDIIFNQL